MKIFGFVTNSRKKLEKDNTPKQSVMPKCTIECNIRKESILLI